MLNGDTMALQRDMTPVRRDSDHASLAVEVAGALACPLVLSLDSASVFYASEHDDASGRLSGESHYMTEDVRATGQGSSRPQCS